MWFWGKNLGGTELSAVKSFAFGNHHPFLLKSCMLLPYAIYALWQSSLCKKKKGKERDVHGVAQASVKFSAVFLVYAILSVFFPIGLEPQFH